MGKVVNTGYKIKIPELALIIFSILFVFQPWLDNYISVFSYIDEITALITAVVFSYRVLCKGKIKRIVEYKSLIYFLAAYVAVSLIGNVVYRYQVLSSVVIDLFTNLKFYLSLGLASALIKKADPQSFTKLLKVARLLTLFLFGTFIIDYFISVFPHGYRYGIKYTQLFFGHPTYMAGCCVFLVALLAFYGAKKNLKYILLDIFMLAMTLRGKAIVGALVFLVLYYIIIIAHSKLKTWQIIVIGIMAIAVAWQQIQFYFVELSGLSARSVMLRTSFKVLKDYFPIGTGFGTYGSHEAFANYSPVYVNYGFRNIDELSGYGTTNFFDDQFWPIVIGQSGALGTICYLGILTVLFVHIQRMRKINTNAYMASMFVFLYLIISSTSEPAYNNSIAIPMGVVIGMSFLTIKRQKMFATNYRNNRWH